MPAVADGIQDLLAAESPGEFHAWTGEKVPLLVGTVFLAPMMLIVLALILRILLFRGQKAEEFTAYLQTVLDKRIEETEGWGSGVVPCSDRNCTGVINAQGVCDTCGKPLL